MREDTTAKKVDETIEALCDWIQSELPVTGSMSADAIVPEIVKALAVLIAARGIAEQIQADRHTDKRKG